MEMIFKTQSKPVRPRSSHWRKILDVISILRRAFSIRIHVHNKSRTLFINPFALKGFVSIQWNKLPGKGILQESAVWEYLGDIDDLIDIKVRERTTELEDAKQQLEAFGYSVSHDLKAPLRVINGYCSILRNSPDMIQGEATEILEIVADSASKMSRLIDDLLKFSKTGSEKISKTKTDMAAMVRVITSELMANTTAKPEVIIHDIPYADCDAGLIRQVWVNLISNAIKYSAKRDHPVIEIGSDGCEGSCVYYVRDNGSGFDMKFSQRLFRPFQRLHSDTDYEGSGIGLALSQRIISKHGGTIWASAEVDKGATFYFSL